MSPETLKDILVSQFNAATEDDEIVLPEAKRVTLLMVAGDTLMPVGRVKSVRFADAYMAVSTEEQRYFVDPSKLFGVRQEDFDAGSKDSRPGFHRT